MNVAADTVAVPSSRDYSPDNVTSGLSFMLIANVLQRGIGFVRNLAVCYLLTDQQLGLWGLASSFFVLAAPLAVLGFPGTFGRFVESYRSRGQLKPFLISMMAVAMLGFLVMAMLLIAMPQASGRLILGSEQVPGDMLGLASALGCIILFNAATELISGLRLPKTVSAMHTVNSLAFTFLCLAGLLWHRDWRVLVAAFGASAVLGMVPAIRVLARPSLWNGESNEPFSNWNLWRRVVPFAASVWMINLILNTFDVVDRYMLLHLVSHDGGSEIGQAMVGQLHSAKLIPTLLSNLAVMLGGVLLPYLVADWESDRRDRVAAALSTTTKLGTIFLFGLSIGSLLVAPFLFRFLLSGRYSDGLLILPYALVGCCWMAASTFLNNYFWCAEKGRLLGVLTAASLIANVGLSWWLIPILGIQGAMIANCIACALLVLLLIGALRTLGVVLDMGTLVVVLLPISLLLGALPAALAWSAWIVTASRTNWLLTASEKQSIDSAAIPILRRFGIDSRSIWTCV